jgi:hypothetical protein
VAWSTHALGALTLEKIWGSSGPGDGQFQVPQGVAVNGAGDVYVADQNNNRIQKFTADGVFILRWGSFGSNDGQLGSPTGVAVDGAGNVYVADWGNYRVGKFTSDGTFIQQIGVGYFQAQPRMLTIAPNGDLYVTESTRVSEFTTSGTLVRNWGSQGNGQGQFNAARGIVADAASNVYVADANNSNVQKFSPTGQFLSSFGSFGSGPGQLAAPYGLAIASNGHIFVGDTNAPAIVEFAADGTWVERDGVAGSENFVPQGIAFNSGGDLYIADNQANTGNRVLKVSPTAAPAPSPGPTALPPPVVGKSVNVQVEKGTVLVKPPPGVALKIGVRPAQNGFVALTNAAQIPVGSLVDTTHGQVGMTSAAGTGPSLQKGSFYSGQFKIVQKRATKAITELQLSQPLTCKKGKASGASARSRRLWGNVHGRFRTRGRNSTATVRGTLWLTKDTCSSTLTVVKRGTVVVRDFGLKKNVTVKQGKTYLARKR